MTASAGPPDRRPSLLELHITMRQLEIAASANDNAVEQLKLMESASIVKRMINTYTGAFGHVKQAQAKVEIADGTIVSIFWRDGQIIEAVGEFTEISHKQRQEAIEVVQSIMAARTAAGLEAEPLYVQDQLARIKQAIRKTGPGRKPIDAIKDIEVIIDEIREWLQVPRRVR